MESKILQIIKSRSDWRSYLEDKSIRIKDKYPFMIFNYGVNVDPADPIIREARGIIIDMEKFKVACWPFDRFYNSYEEAAKEDLDHFDWAHCRIEEKIDGSLVKLFWNEYSGRWQWATNSCIDADDADTFCGRTFKQLIESAGNYTNIVFDALDKNCTYMFELISPFQQIVIKYPKTMLYHIGTRNNQTGEEDWRYIGIMHPEAFGVSTLEECLKAAERLNPDGKILNEGFVVVDKNWRRLKVKSPEYVDAHRTLANRAVTKEHIIEVIRSQPEIIDGICKDFPDLAVYYRYYQYKMEELLYDVRHFVNYVRCLYEEYNHDRKAVALTIKDLSLASFGFEALKSDADVAELIANIPNNRYYKLITDYQENDVIHKKGVDKR